MPTYRVHDRVGLFVGVGTGVAFYTYDIPVALTIGASIIIGTYYFSPDLDIDSKMNQRWGILRFIWYPYKKFIPHRSFFSHSGPISGTFRLLYFMAIILLPILLFYPAILPDLYDFCIEYALYCLYIWFGLMISDTIHTVLDCFW